jgi:hypothetical protein
MTKLYKDTPEGMLYWGTWEHEGTDPIHWGKVGETGQVRELRGAVLENAEKGLQQEMRPDGMKATRKQGIMRSSSFSIVSTTGEVFQTWNAETK